jgi:hypothetical protein
VERYYSLSPFSALLSEVEPLLSEAEVALEERREPELDLRLSVT